jgi:hypothetical protein
MVAITAATVDRSRIGATSPGAQRISHFSPALDSPGRISAGDLTSVDSLPRIIEVPLLHRLANYRKAVVSGLGAMLAVAMSVKDPLGSVLPGATQWIAVGMAAATAIATYLTTNTAPTPPALVPTPPQEAGIRGLVDKPQCRTRFGTAFAGLVVVTGGILWARRSRGSSCQDAPKLAVIVHPNDFGTFLTKCSGG